MKTLYLDCVSGIAGDMTLSALVDLGADPDYIKSYLSDLPIDSFTMDFVPVVRKGISAQWLKLSFHNEARHENGGLHDHGHTHDHYRAHPDHPHGPGRRSPEKL